MVINILVGETMTGRITDTIPVTGMSWSDVLNQTGAVEGVTVPRDVVADIKLRQRSQGMRTFLAVERDGRVKQGGPITSRGWDWEKGQASFGAKGMWVMTDRRIVYDDSTYDTGGLLTFSGVSLGGLAVSLVQHMLNAIPPFTNLPIVLPAIEPGDHTESFARWSLARYGEQLRQITQRAVDAPDIRFQPRRRADDPRYLEWVMQVGSELQPSLTQGGPDWVFDTTAPRSPVRGISTDEDPSQMATGTWITGNGSEADMKLARGFDDGTLLNNGWPYTEADEAHTSVTDNATLLGYADALQRRLGRPIEVFTVSVSADAAAEVLPGDYCRVITQGDPWLGDMDQTMRVRQVSGDLSDVVKLEMFPLAGAL